MYTQVFEGIETVDQDLWQRVTAGHPFAGWSWCQYSEAMDDSPVYYAVVFDDGDQPVGGAIFALMRDESVPATNRLVLAFLRLYLGWRPLVVCRTAPFTDHKGFFLPADPALQPRVLDEIRRMGQAVAQEYGASFLLVDYLSADDMRLPGWDGFTRVPDFTNIGMALHVEWDTFDEFMAHLKKINKKAHKNVRHNMRYAEEAGITVTRQHATPPEDIVMDLLVNKMQHYDVPFEPHKVRRVLRGITVLDEQQVTWIVAHHQGRIVGVELVLNDPETRVCKPTLYGRDYTVEFVYFAMSYEDIRYAIEDLKARTVIYDTEAYDFKRRMGMVEDPRNNLVLYPGSWAERRLVDVLMRFMDD